MMLREFIKSVKSRKDIWVTSPHELVKYWRAAHPAGQAAETASKAASR
jgi:hypothetical protein